MKVARRTARLGVSPRQQAKMARRTEPLATGPPSQRTKAAKVPNVANVANGGVRPTLVWHLLDKHAIARFSGTFTEVTQDKSR